MHIYESKFPKINSDVYDIIYEAIKIDGLHENKINLMGFPIVCFWGFDEPKKQTTTIERHSINVDVYSIKCSEESDIEKISYVISAKRIIAESIYSKIREKAYNIGGVNCVYPDFDSIAFSYDKNKFSLSIIFQK